MAQQDYSKLFKAWQPQTTTPSYNNVFEKEKIKLELQAYQNQLEVINAEQTQRKKASTGTRILETIADVPLSLIEGFSKGVEGLVDAGRGVIGGIGGLFGADDFQQRMADKIAYDWTGQNIGRAFEGITDDSYIDNTIFDKAITSVGQMLPSIGLSMIAPGLGTVGFMASAGGSGMEEALNYGADYKKSFLYGLASGVTEGLIESVSGGIGGIGSGFVDGLFGKLTKNTAVKIGISMLGEGAEEVAGELVRPKLERIYKNKEDIDPITLQTVAESFIVGALASGILQGASVKLSSYANKKQANQINTEIGEITTLEEQLVENDKMTPEIAENLKEQKTEKLAQIEQIIEPNINTQTTQENAENGLKNTEISENETREQTQEEVPKEILSTKSNTGEVYRQGDYVYKNSFKGNKKTLESEVYSALKNNDNVLSGEETTINGKQMIKTPYVENIISIDTIPLDDRKNYGEMFSRDDINNIVNAINELSLLGYDYSDALQFAYQDGKFKLFDFSNVSKKTIAEATKNNYMYLYNFLKDFGLDNYSNKIGKGMRIRNLLQTFSRDSIESGRAFVLKENEKTTLLKLHRFNASPNNVYVTYNGRTIPGVAQTNNLENGYKYVYTEKPLSKQFIKEWELETLFETKQTQQEVNQLETEALEGQQQKMIEDVKTDVTKDTQVIPTIKENLTVETINKGGENITPPPSDNTPPPSDNTPPSTPNPLAHPSENVDTVNKVAISEDITKPKKSRWQEFKRKYINSMVEVENFLKGKVKSPETVTHNAKLSSSIASDWVENGVSRVVEKNGKTVVERKSKPFIKLFDFLRGKGKEYKRRYFDYLLHKHNVSRMDIPFKVVATQEQINVLNQALEKNEISQKLYDTLTNTENETKCSEVRNLVLEHEDLMSENTLNTVLELMGEQKPVFGKEVTFEDSERKVAEYERTNPEFKQHAKDIYEYNRALLERQVEEGIITEETRDRFNEMYPNYVPTHRLQYGQSNAGIKKGTIQSGIKGAKGSDLVIRPIDQQIFYQTQIVSRSITINPLLKTLGENADGVNVIKSVNAERVDDINKIGSTENNKNRFTYFEKTIDENGKETVNQVSIVVNEEIAQGIKSLSPIEMDVDISNSLNKVRKINSMFKKVTTAYNPFFSFWRNPIRDIQNALTYTKFSIKDYGRNFGKAFKIIFFDRNNVEWQTYVASGGMSASIFDYDQSMNSQTKMGKTMSKIESASQLIEQLPRFAEYLASREKGLSVQESILNSAEVTTNFVRSGTVMRTLNSTFMPFSNPKLQGSLKFFRTFATAGSKRAIMLFAVRCAVLGIVPSVLNNLLYDDDDDYKNVRQEDKDLNYLFKVGDTWIKIPKGQLISGISATYNRLKNAKDGDDFAFDGYLQELNQAISPVENLRTIFSPFTDIKTNTTWYGGNIEGMKFNNVRPRDRYDESTSWIAKGIGQAINYSPKKIHYLIDQYSGVIGDIILPMTTPKYDKGVLEKTFVYDAVSSNKYSGQFYKLLEEENYKKTDGDMLAKARFKFLNKVKNSLSELYKEQQKINNSNLSNKEKEQQVKAIQILINNTLKNALENVKTFEKIISNFELSETSFDEDYRHATKLAFGSEVALKEYNKQIYEKASALNMAQIDFDIFYDAYFNTKEMYTELDELGNAISGSKKAQISAYIEALPISSVKKYMLFGALGYKSSKGEKAVKQYVNMLNLSKEEKKLILKACNYD